MPPTERPAPTLSWTEGRLLRRGEPWQLLAGSLHYFRVHPALWRDRLLRLADLGLNAVDSYIPWNFHQGAPDRAPDFTGWRDVERFLLTAQEVGLDAVVRPGPYICAEWSNGGLPTWLTGRGIPLRTVDPRFLEPVAEWFAVLLERIAPLQATAGGPVVAVQVENEFGSYGDDPDYVPAIRELLVANGIHELLYTADGPTGPMLDAGAIPDALVALNLGSRAGAARELLAARRPGQPFVCGEFWNGWFDHWEGPHHVRDAASAAETLAEIVADGGSVSIYMAHGGSNFESWAGANDVDGELRTTTTSYDSDAPIAEDGRLTEKFHAMRAVLGATAPIRSAPPAFLTPCSTTLAHGARLGTWRPTGARTAVPCSVDAQGIDTGLVRFDAAVRTGGSPVTLQLSEVRDRAHLYLDGEFLGSLRDGGELALPGQPGEALLTIVVEADGRINYGPRLGEPKGLLGPVLLGRRMVQWWDCAPLPFAAAPEAARAPRPGAPGRRDPEPGFATAWLDVAAPADAHLALPDSGRGYLWLNGFLLGRFSSRGPQRTLYAPAPLWTSGRNEITVLELERPGTLLEVRDAPELGDPEPFIETFD